MVVEQEMAEIYPPDPEDLCEFLPETDCAKCGYTSCMEFAAAILKVEVDAHKCADLDSEFAELDCGVEKGSHSLQCDDGAGALQTHRNKRAK
jgi:ArsR family metal-binding transcriptional regulator